MKIILFLPFLGVLMTGCAHENIGDYSHNTYKVDAEVPYTYTVYTDLLGCDKNTVLYYLHGSNGDETTWYAKHQSIIREWRKTGKPSPVVVGITFGKTWQLIPKNSYKTHSGYLEFFVNNAMPAIEKTLDAKITRRYVMGISLGGSNTAQLLFRYPGLFQKGVIVSPFIFPISIFSDTKDIDSFIRIADSGITGVKPWIIKNILKNSIVHESVYSNIAVLKNKYIPDEKAWNNTDIMRNMEKRPESNPLKIYISCGDQDENGFYPGTEKLALKAQSLSYPVVWKTLSGGHSAINEKDIAAFLIE